jgi:aspartate kinase
MERPVITAVTYDKGESKITIRDVPDRPGIAARIFSFLADNNINIDMIIQNISDEGTTDISFTVSKEDTEIARELSEKIAKELNAGAVEVDRDIAKVSLVGAGMRTHPGVAAKMFAALADKGINIEMISTSPIKISVVIREDKVEEAVRAVHDAFLLEDHQVYEEREI